MNKTNLPTWLSGLCAVLLISSLVLESKRKSQLESLRQSHEAFVSATSQRQRETHDTISKLAGQTATNGTNLESRLAQGEQQTKEKMGETFIAVQQQIALARASEQHQKEQRVEREKNFREMREQLDELVSSGALFPNKSKPAGEATALAKAAEKAGDTNLAKIYYLSAINHAPSEFSMLKNYAELVFRDSSATAEDIARLKSVLQISLYQIPPTSVTSALGLLSEAVRREEQLLAAQNPKPVPMNWPGLFEQLTKSTALDNSWADLKQISRRWDGLNEIVESLREEQPDSALTKRVERELELTQRVLAAARFANALDTMMAALNSSSEQPEKAVSLLQTAEATLGQLWGIDSAGWPAALRSKIDQYPKEIQRRVEVVAEVKSRPFLAKVEAERDSAKSYVKEANWKLLVAKGQPYQKVVTNCDGCFERAAAAAQNISSADGRKKAEAAIKEIRDIAVDAKRKQFDAYQKWAVGQCETAFYAREKDGFYTDADAEAYSAYLAKIDQKLLSSETSRLFTDVLNKLTAGRGGETVFGIQKRCATPPWKTLEEF